MAINAFFERAQLEERVDIKGLLLLDEAFYSDDEGSLQAAGILCQIALIDAEFVIIVVMRNVIETGRCCFTGGEGTSRS